MSLDGLGLTALQERLYRLLVAGAFTDTDELARAAGTSAPEATAALAAMTESGLLTLGPTGYAVLAPASALGALIEAREEDLLAALRRVSSLRQDAVQLDALFRRGNREREASDELLLERIDELAEIRERLDELSFHSRRSVFSLQPGGPQPKETLEASRALDLRGRRRRIDARIVHERSRLDDELNRAYLRELSLLGADIRVTDAPLSRLIVVDDEVAILPADPLGGSRSALVVRHPALVAALGELFRRVWDDAHEIVWDAAEPADFELADDDRRVLSLLAEGDTDEAIAREVGVSVRHLRRRIARLMQELEAGSRFEAGVLAARRGWV